MKSTKLLVDGWFPFTDSINENRLLGPPGGKEEVSLGGDCGGQGVAPDNGAITNGVSGVSLGGEVSVGSGGYRIGNPSADPNDDQGEVPTDSGGGGD